MKKHWFCFLLPLCLTLSGKDDAELFARADKEDALYQAGEKIVFSVVASEEAPRSAEYRYTVTEGGETLQSGVLKTTDGKGEISVTPGKPGFVLLSIEIPYRGSGKKAKPVLAGAGVSVDKIAAGTPENPKFNQFWQEKIRELRSREYTTEIREVEGKYDPRAKVYEVRISDGKLNVTGYMVLPASPVEGGHPILMMYNGASTIGAIYPSAVQRVIRYNMIVFNLSIHDVPNGLSPQEQAKIRRERHLIDYMYRGVSRPEDYPIFEIFMRGVRALDYMKTRPEWNGREIVTQGGSLGGAQALFAASIEPKTVMCIANAPALSDHFGASAGHLPGWPNLFSELARRKLPSQGAEQTASYFDTVNIARNIRCPIHLSVGFIDQICPPDSIYALYNSLTQEKTIANVVTGGHGPVIDPKEKSAFVQNMEYLDSLFLKRKSK